MLAILCVQFTSVRYIYLLKPSPEHFITSKGSSVISNTSALLFPLLQPLEPPSGLLLIGLMAHVLSRINCTPVDYTVTSLIVRTK